MTRRSTGLDYSSAACSGHGTSTVVPQLLTRTLACKRSATAHQTHPEAESISTGNLAEHFFGSGPRLDEEVREPHDPSVAVADGYGLTNTDRDAIREWSRSAAAKQAGIEPLGGRGRIAAKVIEAWQNAQ